jgi:hypothetical protein
VRRKKEEQVDSSPKVMRKFRVMLRSTVGQASSWIVERETGDPVVGMRFPVVPIMLNPDEVVTQVRTLANDAQAEFEVHFEPVGYMRYDALTYQLRRLLAEQSKSAA